MSLPQPIETHPVVVSIAAKTEDNAKQISDNKTSLDKVWAATFDWASFFQTPTGKAIGVMAVTLLGLVVGQINTWMKPPTPIVVTTPVIAAPVEPIKQPSPIEPQKVGDPKIAPLKLIVYTLDGKELDRKAFNGLSVSITTDAKAWPAGSYKFNDKTVEFPAGVLYSADMKTLIDAKHYDSVDDLVEMVKANTPKGK